jgi:hypothetical protein
MIGHDVIRGPAISSRDRVTDVAIRARRRNRLPERPFRVVGLRRGADGDALLAA